MTIPVSSLKILGLSAIDRGILESELPADQLQIKEPPLSEGRSGVFEPLTATVILTLAALAGIALFICRRTSEETRVERPATETAPAETITIRKTAENCKVEALAQLTKAFADLIPG